ncbi:MAG: LysM peptidoglycan-binding domain-containing protein [Paracoccaceae bacterium]
MQPGAPEEPLPAAEVAGAAVPEGTSGAAEEESAAVEEADPVTAEVAATEPAPEVAPEPVPEAAVEPAVEPAAEPEPLAEPEPAPMAPGFDVVRIEPDGSALIAGTAPPDTMVSLQLDGVEEIRVQADPDGKFVALFTLAPNPAPRLLSLMATLDDGSDLPGAATVAIAPIAATVPVASAEPVAEPAAEPEAVAEPEPPATLLVTEEGAEVIQPPVTVPAGEPVPVSLDAIAYAPDGAVQLSGRGAAGQGLRIYLDNLATTDASVAEDGTWAVTLPETAPGIYTMRIDQIAADGAVSARFETPFKRETAEALALAAAPPAVPESVVEAVPEPVAEPEAVAAPAPLPEPVAEAAEPVVTEEQTAPVPTEPEAAGTSEPEAAVVPAPEPEVAEPAAVAAVAPVTITVQPGFTLWGIATDMMGEGTMYVQVFEANKDKIRDPDLIYPGQVFTLPQE